MFACLITVSFTLTTALRWAQMFQFYSTSCHEMIEVKNLLIVLVLGWVTLSTVSVTVS